jgi:surfeit locus 1 family protein
VAAPATPPTLSAVTTARFLLRPRWILSHLLVVLLVVVMVNLGFWQLRRLEERRDRNALIEERREVAAVPVEDLLAPGDGDAAVDDARYRAVTVSGRYDAGATVVVRNRTQDGAPGAWLLTPVELDGSGGVRVGVVRGFVPLGDDGEPVAVPPPGARDGGGVTVRGWVARADRFDGTAPRDIERALDRPGMLPAVVLAETSEPAEPGDQITPVAQPDLHEGPHLSYAVQWFIFSTIAVVGYPLVLRRVVDRRGREVDDPGADHPGRRPTDPDRATGARPGEAGGDPGLDEKLQQLLRE